MLFLSIDFGTSAVKMSIVDEKGETLEWSKQDYPYMILPGEKVEIAPDELFKGLYGAANKLDPDLRKKIDVICYDTFSPSPVFMDKKGDLVYPNIITHLDRRSRAQTDFIEEHFGNERYMNISGILPFAGGCSAMTIIWFKQNMPEVLEKTYSIGHLPSYIHKKLTGRFMVDLVNASMIGLYETTTQGGWSRTLLDDFGLNADWFGEIYNPGTILGNLLAEPASKLGVPEGIPVAVGTNDVSVAQLGAHNKKAGEMMNTAGSSDMISILTDKPIVNKEYYLRNAALPGLWQIYVTTCGGFGVDWFYEQFCKEMSKDEFFNKFLPESIEKHLESDTVSFEPFLTGDRQSLQKKTASWSGLTLSATKGEMLCSMLTSMQQVLKKAIDQAAALEPLSDTIKISGGMTKDAYMKIKRKEIPGYKFEVVDDCPILGNVECVKHYM